MNPITRLLALFIFAGFMVACQPAANNQALRTVDATEFKKLADAHQAVVIDVRHADEFAEDHLEGAVNIDVEDPGFSTAISSLDKSKTYLVYCRAGHRSLKAANEMTGSGFKAIVNLDGGITSWKDNGFPVTK